MKLTARTALDERVFEMGIARLPNVLPHHIMMRRKMAPEKKDDRLIFRVDPWFDIWCRANVLYTDSPDKEILSHVLDSDTEDAKFFRRCAHCDDLFRHDMTQGEIQDDQLRTLEGWDAIPAQPTEYGRATFLDVTDRPDVDLKLPQPLRRLLEPCRLIHGRDKGFRVLVADWRPIERANCIYKRMIAILV